MWKDLKDRYHQEGHLSHLIFTRINICFKTRQINHHIVLYHSQENVARIDFFYLYQLAHAPSNAHGNLRFCESTTKSYVQRGNLRFWDNLESSIEDKCRRQSLISGLYQKIRVKTTRRRYRRRRRMTK